MNEYYVSHYIDYTPLTHPERCVLAARQNLSMAAVSRAVIGSLNRGVSFATTRSSSTVSPPVPVRHRSDSSRRAFPARRQHEHSMAVIQDASLTLVPRHGASGFWVVRARSPGRHVGR